ncbi:hypothetical protein K431DRAFT_286989 [Polychaeton citri CBS 116435]|uniref:Uncharacterized protein n=1 Tax=Polychaeton citri CBS 116435 TaxID=1314669 RepID=A0A9P4Q3Y1_9PEZI|nr:hypothetical protein K431DRAFT_286989 [Polychaeton citri CBS 116435]
MEESQFHLELQRLNQRIHEMSLRQAQRSPLQQHLHQQRQLLPIRDSLEPDLKGYTGSYPLLPMTQPELPDSSNNGSDLFEAQLKGIKAHINGILGSLQPPQYQPRDEVVAPPHMAVSQASEGSEQDLWSMVSRVSFTVAELRQRQDDLEDRVKAIGSPTVFTPATCSISGEVEQQDEVQEMDASPGFASQESQDSEHVSFEEEFDQTGEVQRRYSSSYPYAVRRLLQDNYNSQGIWEQQKRPLSGHWLDGPGGHPYGLSQTPHLKLQLQRFLQVLEPEIGMCMRAEKELSPIMLMSYLRKSRDYLIYCSRELEHSSVVMESSHQHFRTGSAKAKGLVLEYSGIESTFTKQAQDHINQTARGHSDAELHNAEAHYLECLLNDLEAELHRRDSMLYERDETLRENTNVIGDWKQTEKSKRADLRKEFWNYRHNATAQLEEKDRTIESLKRQLRDRERKDEGVGLGIVPNVLLHHGNDGGRSTDLDPHRQVKEAVTPTCPSPSDSCGINTRYRTMLSDPFWQPQSTAFPHEVRQQEHSYLSGSKLSQPDKCEAPSWHKQQSRRVSTLEDGWGAKPSIRWTYDTNTSAHAPSQAKSWSVNQMAGAGSEDQTCQNADKSTWRGMRCPEAGFRQPPHASSSNTTCEYVIGAVDKVQYTQQPGTRKLYNQKIFNALRADSLREPAVDQFSQSYCPIPDTSKPPLPAPTAATQPDKCWPRFKSPAPSHITIVRDTDAYPQTPTAYQSQTNKPISTWDNPISAINFPEHRHTELWGQLRPLRPRPT